MPFWVYQKLFELRINNFCGFCIERQINWVHPKWRKKMNVKTSSPAHTSRNAIELFIMCVFYYHIWFSIVFE